MDESKSLLSKSRKSQDLQLGPKVTAGGPGGGVQEVGEAGGSSCEAATPDEDDPLCKLSPIPEVANEVRSNSRT